MSSLWWSLRLRREAASVPLARRLLLGSMESAGVDPEIAFELSLALSEACANAVEHGRETGGRVTGVGAYRVSAYLDGNRCRIEVADTGPGFPEGSGPPCGVSEAENGRGLFLIESLADHVRFRNRPGRRGAVVTFDKLLDRDEQTLLTAS
ncbi:ATP-binding protein [Streptomyces iconiensis]|uniref:ATP-binding protein n=1 Tax=Streptomyces iconiensis TaxID=1384038 RepID=A0ABT7A4A8_9ACTN|nr:ATP-binding protein [Streptomyces iconiensis]MDJ1136178.1 ATP-binding protein [Streptomyces iconiensis]